MWSFRFFVSDEGLTKGKMHLFSFFLSLIFASDEDE